MVKEPGEEPLDLARESLAIREDVIPVDDNGTGDLTGDLSDAGGTGEAGEAGRSICVLRLVGALDIYSVDELVSRFWQVKAQQQYSAVVIDLSGVVFIDSGGLTLLITFQQDSFREAPGSFAVLLPQNFSQPQSIIKRMRLDRAIPVGTTLQEALEAAARLAARQEP